MPSQIWDLNRGLRDLEAKSRVAVSNCPAMVDREGRPEQLSSNQRPASPGRPTADLHRKLENHKEINVFLQTNCYDQVIQKYQSTIGCNKSIF